MNEPTRMLVADAGEPNRARLVVELRSGWSAENPRTGPQPNAPRNMQRLDITGVCELAVADARVYLELTLELRGGALMVSTFGVKTDPGNSVLSGLISSPWPVRSAPSPVAVGLGADTGRLDVGEHLLQYDGPANTRPQQGVLLADSDQLWVQLYELPPIGVRTPDPEGLAAEEQEPAGYALLFAREARLENRIVNIGTRAYAYRLRWSDQAGRLEFYRSTWNPRAPAPPVTVAQFTFNRSGEHGTGLALLGMAGRGLIEYWNSALLTPYLQGPRHLNTLPVIGVSTRSSTDTDALLGLWALLFERVQESGPVERRWKPFAARLLAGAAASFLFRQLRRQDGGRLTVEATLIPDVPQPPDPGAAGDQAGIRKPAVWLNTIAGQIVTMVRTRGQLVLDARGVPATSGAVEREDDDSLRARVPVAQTAATGPSGRMRLGAFDFELTDSAQPSLPEIPDVRLRVSWNDGRFLPAAGLNDAAELNASVEIGVAAVQPGGQDAPLNAGGTSSLRSKLDPGLVIPLPSAKYSGSTLSLRIYQTAADAGQSIRAELLNRDTDTPPPTTSDRYCLPSAVQPGGQAVVLDRQPLLIALVEYPFFIVPDDASGYSIVARWSSGRWTYRVQQNGEACLVLPPQGWGEEMEREGTLRGSETAPLDWRLGQPLRARFSLGRAPAYFKEVPWNVERLFQETMIPSVQEPELKALQFELLYGMPCIWENAPGWFVLADVERRLGRVPDAIGPLAWSYKTAAHQQAHAAAEQRWAYQYERYHSRALVLEPVLRDQLYSLDPFLLTSGLRCEVLSPARSDTRHPVLEGQGDRTALRGGALIGIENLPVYTAITNNPRSTSAVLSGGAFTSLGGYGHIDANYGNSRILARVDMGRISEYTVERKGRIAVFWNRAKHVVVYQRTVAPSEQFGLFQAELTGRAVVRKVHEYVEIEEESRRFQLRQDALTSNPLDPGFVTGCHFPKGTRINVRSAWGSDVGTVGWQLPLWNPAAAAQQPRVYPKPDITLSVVGGGRRLPVNTTPTEESLTQLAASDVPCILLEPQNVFFFTYTADETQDASAWPAVEGVDYVNLAVPTRPRAPAGGSPEASTATVPADAVVPPGFERFTFRVQQGEERTNLVAARVHPDAMDARSTDARIQAVTMLRGPRGAPQATPGEQAALAALTGIPGLLEQAHQATLELLPYADPRQPARTVREWIAGISTPALPGIAGERAAEALRRYRQAVQGLAQAPGTILTQRASRAGGVTPQQVQGLVSDVAGRLTGANGLYRDVLRDLASAADDLLAPVERLVATGTETEKRERVLQHLRDVADELYDRLSHVPATPEPLLQVQIQAVEQVQQLVRRWDAEKNALVVVIDEGRLTVEQVRSWLTLWEARLAQVERQLSASRAPWLVHTPTLVAVLQAPLRDALATMREALAPLDPLRIRPALLGVVAEWSAQAPALVGRLCPDTATSTEPDLVRRLQGCSELAKRVEVIHTALRAAVPQPIPSPAVLRQALEQTLQAELAQFTADLTRLATAWRQRATGDFNRFRSVLGPEEARLTAALEQARTGVETLLRQLEAQGQQTREEVERAVLALREQAEASAQTFAQQVGRDLRPLGDLARPGLETAERALRLVRAFGEPPELSNLGFSRDRLAYYFQEPNAILQDVGITPVVAYLDRVGSELKAIGLDLPIEGLREKLLPSLNLEQFQLSRIFRDFSGLRLDSLLSGLKIPPRARENLVVRHSTDAAKRRVTVQAALSTTRIAEQSTLFSVGPLEVALRGADFSADATFSTSLDTARTERRIEGSIVADWELRIGGTAMITFRQTRLTFRSPGSLTFDVDPRRVELSSALQFLTQLMESLGGDLGSGLSIAVSARGVESVLDTALPPLQTGTFAITNLRLGARFGLEFGNEFALAVGAFLARRDAPFALTIFVLGGGGFLDIRSRYVVSTGRLSAQVAIGITANATVGVALGPIRGSVFVALGFTAEFATSGGSGSRGLRIGVLFLLRGEVSVLGIVDVMLSLELHAAYDPAGRIRGTGVVSLRIKICWCYTLKVRRQINYTLGCDADRLDAGHASRRLPASRIRELACHYVTLLA